MLLFMGSATPAIQDRLSVVSDRFKDTMSILLFAGVRFLLAGFLVILFNSVNAGSWIWPEKGSGWSVIKLSLAQTVGQYYFFYVGLAHASGVHGAIITGMNVFIAILMASLVFHYET